MERKNKYTQVVVTRKTHTLLKLLATKHKRSMLGELEWLVEVASDVEPERIPHDAK
tara:strand:- start:157 stop:324 length:168 start_codon:yes stop_codon:yes gene_type:complete